MNLPTYEIESFLKKHEYAFEEFGAVTNQLYNKYNDIYWTQRSIWTNPRSIDKVHLSDISRRKQDKIGIIGATPGYLDSIERSYMSPTQYNSGLTKWTKDETFGKSFK